MGLFSFIANNKLKAEGSIIIENLLNIQKENYMYDGNTNAMAQLCINKSWLEFPDILNGEFGQRPHKITVAITGLTVVLNNADKEHKNYHGLLLALFTALSEFETNHNMYPLSNMDYKLVNDVLGPVIQTFIQEYKEDNKELLASTENWNIPF